MAKRLCLLTTEDMLKQMSIAGSPEKITNLMTSIYDLMAKTVDVNNAAELINTKFALQRMIAEVKVWARSLEGRTGQKYNI